MKNRSVIRKLMIVAGILAALTIVVSPAFQREATHIMMEAQASPEKPADDTQVAAVSSEAITSPQAVQVESANPFIVQEIITEIELPAALPVPDLSFPASALTTLLKSVISPQAP